MTPPGAGGGLSLGNCFGVAGIVVAVPFMSWMHVPKESESRGRGCPVPGTGLARSPLQVPSPAPLASNAVLNARQPPSTGKQGHPRWKGDRLGTRADLAKAVTWTKAGPSRRRCGTVRRC